MYVCSCVYVCDFDYFLLLISITMADTDIVMYTIHNTVIIWIDIG